ncbi:MAG: TonB family protein [Massilia sp.]
MNFSLSPSHGAAGTPTGALLSRLQPLAAIVVAHAVVFFFIYSGLLHRAVQMVAPGAVMVSFVATDTPKQEAPAPKVAPVVMREAPPVITPPVPLIVVAPTEHAISVPQPVAAQPEKNQPPSPAVVAAAPAPAPPRSGPRTITSGVEYIQPPQVVYPNMSKRLGEQGKVVLRVLINEKGLPDQVLVERSSGSARLDEAGRQAALRALYKPYIEDGRPVSVFVFVPLTFALAS